MANNADTIRRFYDDVWNKRREATIDEVLAPDLIGRLEGRDVTGTEQFKASWRELLAAFPDTKISVEDAIEHDNKVAVRWRVESTHQGELAGIPPTHQKVAARGMSWFEFENGKVVRGWDSWNQGAVLMSLMAAVKAK